MLINFLLERVAPESNRSKQVPMDCLELDSSQFSSNTDAIDNPLDIHLEFDSFTGARAVPSGGGCSSPAHGTSVPDPPPLPGPSYYGVQKNSRTERCRWKKACRRVPEEVLDSWDKLFSEGYRADIRVSTDDGTEILAHSCVLGVKSPVLRTMVEESKPTNGFRCIRISGVPPEATRTFVRFLYSSRFEQEQMRKHALHLLVLSHVFSVPSLKTVCIDELERNFLAPDNVVDMLQLARLCDAPRLSLVCTRTIIGDFKSIALSDGWKAMRQANPSLEQELLESLVEADTKRQERAKRMAEKEVYLQLYEATKALVHICREGCRTIGPRDQALMTGSRAAVCKFPACKGVELLVRHFSVCRFRVPGGCANCKRMWQLLELHSRMCFAPDTCKVPLCRQFKEKMQHLGRKEETKWNLLVCKVLESRGTISCIAARRKILALKGADSCRMVPHLAI